MNLQQIIDELQTLDAQNPGAWPTWARTAAVILAAVIILAAGTWFFIKPVMDDLDAAKAQNIQGISAYWGDKDGSARGRFPKAEEEQREIIMARCLRHDRYEVIGDAPAMGGGRTFAVALTRPGKSVTTNFEVVPAVDHRWYVQQVDMEKLADYCR